MAGRSPPKNEESPTKKQKQATSSTKKEEEAASSTKKEEEAASSLHPLARHAAAIDLEENRTESNLEEDRTPQFLDPPAMATAVIAVLER